MANKLGTFIKKRVLRKDQNLISLEEPYDIIRSLLSNHRVTGILDAGASRGHISERMLRRFPDAHVYAFEPNLMYKEVLGKYAAEEPRFHPQFMALSDHEGMAQLHVTKAAGNTSLLNPTEKLSRIDPVGSVVKETVSVPIVTIDQWAEDNGDLAIQLMKFDIQGYELTALKGAVRMLRDSTLVIYSEIWFNSVYENGALFSDIDTFLRDQGFILYDIFKPKYNRNDLIQWANAIFVHAERLGL